MTAMMVKVMTEMKGEGDGSVDRHGRGRCGRPQSSDHGDDGRGKEKGEKGRLHIAIISNHLGEEIYSRFLMTTISETQPQYFLPTGGKLANLGSSLVLICEKESGLQLVLLSEESAVLLFCGA